MRSSVGTAKEGVPRNIRFNLPLAPFTGLRQFPDFAANQIALQSAYVRDIQTAVQVIDFMRERPRQQFLAGSLERFALNILRAHANRLGARHLFPKTWNAEAAFFAGLRAFAMNNLGIEQNDFLFRVLAHG